MMVQPITQNLIMTTRGPRQQGVGSKFDMPIEFHIDFLREKQSNKEQIRKGSSMRTSIGGGASGRRSRFEDLDPQFFYKRMSLKPTFAFIRELAIEMLQSNVNKKLKILLDTQACKKDQVIANETLPHKLFSWMREDFVSRRRVPNCMYVVVLEKSLSSTCLEILKFKADLESLQLFLDLIFAGCLCDDEDIDIKVHVLHYIQDAYEFISISDTIDKEVKANKIVFNQGVNSLMALNSFRRDSKLTDRRQFLENTLNEAYVWDPIELRYQTSYYENKTTQCELKTRTTEERLMNDMQDVLTLIEKENNRARSTLDMYYSEIELYKQRAIDMTMLYDRDYDKYENDLSYKKISLDKLREQRKFHVEQLERFRQDLEQLRLKVIAEKELAALKAKELEAASKKKGKGKRRGKGKGKGKGQAKKK